MRRAAFLLALGLLAGAAPASAHEGPDHLQHISPSFGPLQAGASKVFHLQFENGSFVADWVFMVYGGVFKTAENSTPEPRAALKVALAFDGTNVTAWDWAQGWNFRTVTLPETGEYDLTLSNPNPFDVSYAFYFDQSCDCSAKTITLPEGLVLFNYDFRKGEHASFQVPLLAGWEVEATVAKRSGPAGAWPQDFGVVATARHADKGWLMVNWTATEAATHYVLVQAVAGVQFSLDPDQMRTVEVTPLVEREEARGLPGPAWPLVLSAIALALGGRGRPRGGPATNRTA